jgi:chloride channel 7
MGESSMNFVESTTRNKKMEEVEREEEIDPESSNPLNQTLLKRNRTLSSNPLALVGEKVSYIESLDYE